jgi:hypothetical protein
MAVNVAVSIRGDLSAAMRDEGRILRKSVTQGLVQTGRQTRTELLRMMRRNLKLGKRLSGTKSTNLVRVLRKPRRGFGLWDPGADRTDHRPRGSPGPRQSGTRA